MRMTTMLSLSALSLVVATPVFAQDQMATMSKAQMHKMASCQKMPAARMEKNKGCKAMMAAHPDMMAGHDQMKSGDHMKAGH